MAWDEDIWNPDNPFWIEPSPLSEGELGDFYREFQQDLACQELARNAAACRATKERAVEKRVEREKLRAMSSRPDYRLWAAMDEYSDPAIYRTMPGYCQEYENARPGRLCDREDPEVRRALARIRAPQQYISPPASPAAQSSQPASTAHPYKPDP
ncbi:MAG: hypothetical protein Q9163_006030 [Psora crenata]